MAELWFGQSGVTLSQHADVDDRFPGWQENFGAGTFLGNDDFPNDEGKNNDAWARSFIKCCN